jgi:hypothetical protein
VLTRPHRFQVGVPHGLTYCQDIMLVP